MRSHLARLIVAGAMAFPALALAAEEEQPPPMEEKEKADVTAAPREASVPETVAFREKDTYSLKGTVAAVDPGRKSITLERKGLPAVLLHVNTNTRIEVNGKDAFLTDIQPGEEVRAKFNLADDKPIAVKLEAKQKEGEKKMKEERK